MLSDKELIKKLVDKFLAWELPKSVCSDLCVTYNDYPYSRTGTNLLNATEAEQMINYLFVQILGERVCKNCKHYSISEKDCCNEFDGVGFMVTSISIFNDGLNPETFGCNHFEVREK